MPIEAIVAGNARASRGSAPPGAASGSAIHWA